jgi:hypothetical protein
MEGGREGEYRKKQEQIKKIHKEKVLTENFNTIVSLMEENDKLFKEIAELELQKKKRKSTKEFNKDKWVNEVLHIDKGTIQNQIFQKASQVKINNKEIERLKKESEDLNKD